jgi:hypothetical protein
MSRRTSSRAGPTSQPVACLGSGGRDWAVAWGSVGITLVAYCGLAAGLAAVVPTAAEEARQEIAAAAFIPSATSAIRPEPLEKARYLLGLAMIPIVPTVLFLVGRRFVPDRMLAALDSPAVLACRDVAAGCGLVAWASWLCGDSYLPRAGDSLGLATMLAVVAFARRGASPRIHDSVVWCLVAGLAALGFATQLVGDGEFLHNVGVFHHFDVIVSAINQVAHGKTILVNATSQYGILYPYVAAALVVPFGLTVTTLSIFFSVLELIQAALVYRASALPGTTPGWRLFFALAYAGLAAPVLSAALFNAPDKAFFSDPSGLSAIYFQYTPIRTLFFAVFVWLLSPDGRRLVPRLWRLGYPLAGIAFLWNADTGLVVLVAFTATAISSGLADWRDRPMAVVRWAAVHAAAATATVAVALLAYGLFAVARAGRWPDYGEFFRFQQIFYGAGFYMLPMTLREFWQPIVALHALTIAWCLRRAVVGRISQRAAWKFFLAAYGLGSFSYYQGRSHPHNLATIFLPALVLGWIWLWEGQALLRDVPLRRILATPRLRPVAIGVMSLLVFCLCGVINCCRSLPGAIRDACRTESGTDIASVNRLWDSLRHAVGGRPVAVLIDPEGYIHLKTSSWSPLPVSTLTEVFLRDQVAAVQASLDDPATMVLMHDTLMHPLIGAFDLSALSDRQDVQGGFYLLRHPLSRREGRQCAVPSRRRTGSSPPRKRRRGSRP